MATNPVQPPVSPAPTPGPDAHYDELSGVYGFFRRHQKKLLYTAGMFATGHDAANRAVVAAAKTDQLDLVGLGFIADRKIADKITKGLSLHG